MSRVPASHCAYRHGPQGTVHPLVTTGRMGQGHLPESSRQSWRLVTANFRPRRAG